MHAATSPTEGYRQEYKNWLAYAERIEAPILTVPGNHDSRNVGYLHFEDLIGPRMWTARRRGRPDRRRRLERARPERGQGRPRALRLDPAGSSTAPAALKVFALHHHLLPIPGTGRERSTVMDAGDLLEVLIHAGVTSCSRGTSMSPTSGASRTCTSPTPGTVSSLRVRGYTKPCYNVLEFDRGRGARSPAGSRSARAHVMAHFSLSGEQFHREHELPVQERTVPVGD